jgi:hypothetical protein
MRPALLVATVIAAAVSALCGNISLASGRYTTVIGVSIGAALFAVGTAWAWSNSLHGRARLTVRVCVAAIATAWVMSQAWRLAG